MRIEHKYQYFHFVKRKYAKDDVYVTKFIFRKHILHIEMYIQTVLSSSWKFFGLRYCGHLVCCYKWLCNFYSESVLEFEGSHLITKYLLRLIWFQYIFSSIFIWLKCTNICICMNIIDRLIRIFKIPTNIITLSRYVKSPCYWELLYHDSFDWIHILQFIKTS